MEGSAYDLTHMKFLGHYRPQAEEKEEEEEEALCGCCNESGSGGSQRNHHPAQSDTHTHTPAHTNTLSGLQRVMSGKVCFSESVCGPVLMEVSQQLVAGRSINQGR